MIAPEGPPHDCSAGLPVEGVRVSGLAYCSAADCFVAAVGAPLTWYEQLLYVRAGSAALYQPVILPSQVVVSDVLVSDALPVAYLLLRYAEEYSLEFAGIAKLELPSGRAVDLPTPRIGGEPNRALVIVDLLSISESSGYLNVIAAVQTADSMTAESEFLHHLASYEPATGEVVLRKPMATFGA